MIPFSNRFKGPNLDEILAVSELSFAIIALSLKLHFLVEEARKERENLVGDGSSGPEVGREATRRGDVTKVRVGRGQHQLAEFIEIEHIVLLAVILAHNVLYIAHSRV